MRKPWSATAISNMLLQQAVGLFADIASLPQQPNTFRIMDCIWTAWTGTNAGGLEKEQHFAGMNRLPETACFAYCKKIDSQQGTHKSQCDASEGKSGMNIEGPMTNTRHDKRRLHQKLYQGLHWMQTQTSPCKQTAWQLCAQPCQS